MNHLRNLYDSPKIEDPLFSQAINAAFRSSLLCWLREESPASLAWMQRAVGTIMLVSAAVLAKGWL
jgi:hypothetical protein